MRWPDRRTFVRELREHAFAVLLLAPSLVLFGVFEFYPLIKTFYLGFFLSDPFGATSSFVGLDQYWDVLRSSAFHNSLWVTFLYAVFTVPSGLILGLGLALLAHKRLKGMTFFRTVFSSTIATSVAVGSVMWLTLLNRNIGVVNYGLRELSLPAISWLYDPHWALFAVSLTTIWLNLGFTMLVMLAGLQTIPEELYDSAHVDGAGAWSRFVHVTVPMLSSTMLFVVVVLTISAFQSFGQIDLLTQGGPLGHTNVMVYSIYTDAFRDFNRGTAATQAVVLFFIVLSLTYVQIRYLERRVYYGS